MADLALDLCGVKLKNPIIAATGTFGFGREYDELYDIGRTGRHFRQGIDACCRARATRLRASRRRQAACSTASACRTPAWRASSRTTCPWLLTKNAAVIANITGSERGTSTCRWPNGLAGTGVHHAGDEYLLPQCA